jgi:hypothetical protein
VLGVIADPPGDGPQQAEIMTSVDDGRTWSTSVVGASGAASFGFIDGSHWIVETGDGAVQGRTTVKVTSDAGLTWRSVSTLPSGSVAGAPSLQFSFVSPSNGWALASYEGCYGSKTSADMSFGCLAYGQLFSTDDGGGHWALLSVPGS